MSVWPCGVNKEVSKVILSLMLPLWQNVMFCRMGSFGL